MILAADLYFQKGIKRVTWEVGEEPSSHDGTGEGGEGDALMALLSSLTIKSLKYSPSRERQQCSLPVNGTQACWEPSTASTALLTPLKFFQGPPKRTRSWNREPSEGGTRDHACLRDSRDGD